jgi:hypothetical protein
MEDTNIESLSMDLEYRGIPVSNLVDEDLLSIMQGACEEIALADYKSMQNLSPHVVEMAYNMTVVVMGHAGKALATRHAEL